MIDAAVLDRVLARVGELGGATATYDTMVRELRASFPGMHISVCGEDDVPVRITPAATSPDCCLYYVDSGQHCLSLTTDAAAATGLAVALCSGDDD